MLACTYKLTLAVRSFSMQQQVGRVYRSNFTPFRLSPSYFGWNSLLTHVNDSHDRISVGSFCQIFCFFCSSIKKFEITNSRLGMFSVWLKSNLQPWRSLASRRGPLTDDGFSTTLNLKAVLNEYIQKVKGFFLK